VEIVFSTGFLAGTVTCSAFLRLMDLRLDEEELEPIL
jgi:hypothetical protein